ncbi:MAG: 6-carboxytetrahydropterin synthase [Pseudomonadota bacterium]
MKCLECQAEIDQLTNAHLSECCGLTLQEYAIRHHMSLDLLVNESMVNVAENVEHYALPASEVSVREHSIIKALCCVNAFDKQDEFIILNSDARRLDELLWYARELQTYGFQFRQEYTYSDSSHRVIAENKIKTLNAYSEKFQQKKLKLDFELYVSIIVAKAGELFNDYIFLALPDSAEVNLLLKQLTDEYQIRWHALDAIDHQDKKLYRTESLEDGQRLLKLIEINLREIPCVSDRFFAQVEEAIVSKELVFDSAHFITDHPGRCENLHGGRYNLNVKIKGRIDPLTGFVIDYGYLKKVTKKRVIEKLDHQTLNYVDVDIAWRSSTELLNIFIWEQLIDYLPGLQELQTYETPQSYCIYTGPSLEEMQKSKAKSCLKHFSDSDLGKSVLRSHLNNSQKKLKVINE